MVSRRGLWSLEGSGLVLRRWLCADSGHGEGAAPSTQQRGVIPGALSRLVVGGRQRLMRGFPIAAGGSTSTMTVPIMSQPAWGRMQALVEIQRACVCVPRVGSSPTTTSPSTSSAKRRVGG